MRPLGKRLLPYFYALCVVVWVVSWQSHDVDERVVVDEDGVGDHVVEKAGRGELADSRKGVDPDVWFRVGHVVQFLFFLCYNCRRLVQ